MWPLNRQLPYRLLCLRKGYDIAFYVSILEKLNHHVNCSFRNLSGLQYVLENGGVDKFVELIIWAAFIFPKSNLKVLNQRSFLLDNIHVLMIYLIQIKSSNEVKMTWIFIRMTGSLISHSQCVGLLISNRDKMQMGIIFKDGIHGCPSYALFCAHFL